MDFKKNTRPQNLGKKQDKKYILKTLYALLEVRETVLDVFESKIYPIIIQGTGFSDHSNLKILTPKKILERLPIALA